MENKFWWWIPRFLNIDFRFEDVQFFKTVYTDRKLRPIEFWKEFNW